LCYCTSFAPGFQAARPRALQISQLWYNNRVNLRPCGATSRAFPRARGGLSMKYALSHALRRCALALALCLSLTPAAALAEAITTYDALVEAAAAAQDGDVLEL